MGNGKMTFNMDKANMFILMGTHMKVNTVKGKEMDKVLSSTYAVISTLDSSKMAIIMVREPILF